MPDNLKAFIDGKLNKLWVDFLIRDEVSRVLDDLTDEELEKLYFDADPDTKAGELVREAICLQWHERGVDHE